MINHLFILHIKRLMKPLSSNQRTTASPKHEKEGIGYGGVVETQTSSTTLSSQLTRPCVTESLCTRPAPRRGAMVTRPWVTESRISLHSCPQNVLCFVHPIHLPKPTAGGRRVTRSVWRGGACGVVQGLGS